MVLRIMAYASDDWSCACADAIIEYRAFCFLWR